MATSEPTDAARAHFIRDSFPPGGLFAGQTWRISPRPFPLGERLARELETLGRVLFQFYRCANLLYRRSVEGKQPAWIHEWIDLGKPADLIALQRSHAFKNDTPRVIRPDILLTGEGFSITELDSVPGGIGLTAWLNQTYSQPEVVGDNAKPIGGAEGMIRGFKSIFGDAQQIHLVVSEESATYRPEMEWLAAQMQTPRCDVRDSSFSDFKDGDAVYRFFELFDLPNVPNAETIFSLAAEGKLRVTPPPKPLFEEKLLFALLWNRNLQEFWHQELGDSFLRRLRMHVPYTWVVDPAPLPPQGAIPGLNLTDWRQLKAMSHKERELILKVSGFSQHAWGARGVFLGSDLPHEDWAKAVDDAIANFAESPRVLQRFHKPALVDAQWFDFGKNEAVPLKARARLCPYYFVAGQGDAVRPELGGVLATICPADKKIIHGMPDAVLAPCAISA